MGLIKSLFNKSKPESCEIDRIKSKYQNFISILEHNKNNLKIMSEMEEKSISNNVLGQNYLEESIKKVKEHTEIIIENIIEMGGGDYEMLRHRFETICSEIDYLVTRQGDIQKADFVLTLCKTDRSRGFIVGHKMAQLGELRNTLGLNVPRGFSITAWAYQTVLSSQGLQERINEIILEANKDDDNSIINSSRKIEKIIKNAKIPDDVDKAINDAYDEAFGKDSDVLMSVRSSALGEDAGHSFAGQYSTFLGISFENLKSRYLDVISSKFSPKSIYYYLTHKLKESDHPMAVGCLKMVDAAAGGVIYTRNPVVPDEDSIIIHSVPGLCLYLVDGTVTPDMHIVSRRTMHFRKKLISKKKIKLVLGGDNGVYEQEIPEIEQTKPLLTDNQLRELTDIAVRIENHYGRPQDIEWSIDKDGKIYILQTRPLAIVKQVNSDVLQTNGLKKIASGGFTVCPGAGSGKVVHISSLDDFSQIVPGCVIVADQPVAELASVLKDCTAIVTKVGSMACHLATVARQFRKPAIFGISKIHNLTDGLEVTVDATEAKVYKGISKELVDSRKLDKSFFSDIKDFGMLEQVLSKISPLNLVSPAEEDFIPQNCKTIHDITRFIHQRSMELMFESARQIAKQRAYFKRLKTKLPLIVDCLYIDRQVESIFHSKTISDKELMSCPLKAFWSGALEEGWPETIDDNNFKKPGHQVMATRMSSHPDKKFSQNSFAILSSNFMILSLKMGYHFTTFEAMCTDDKSKNYIKMQFKAGGAAFDRRVRRIKLITEVLSDFGFVNYSKGEILDTEIAYISKKQTQEKLYILGRLAMMTKQLDMTLQNDTIMQWYIKDFRKRLKNK